MTAPEPTLTAVDALGVVEQWLDDDEEMRIPGNEWGTRLYEALKDVVRSAREPGAEPALVSEVRRLTEESERLKRGGAELGRILDRTLTMALDASGRHDVIEEDGDGDWEIVWETLAGLRPRAESAEAEVVTLRAKVAAVEAKRDEFADLLARALPAVAALARVEALCDSNPDHADTCGSMLTPGAGYPCSCWQADLRAALATTGEGQHVARGVFTADGIPFVRCSCTNAKSPTSSRWLTEHVPNGGVAELQAVVKRQDEGAKA